MTSKPIDCDRKRSANHGDCKPLGNDVDDDDLNQPALNRGLRLIHKRQHSDLEYLYAYHFSNENRIGRAGDAVLLELADRQSR